MVVAFIGKPHRIDDRGSQVRKALKEIGFEQYYQAKVTGWVLYLEGSTNLASLRAFAERLKHPASIALERPFVHYVANQPSRALSHFHALREAQPTLKGIALYDRLDSAPADSPALRQKMLGRREIENYLCERKVLLSYAANLGELQEGELFAEGWKARMETCIEDVESALAGGDAETATAELCAELRTHDAVRRVELPPVTPDGRGAMEQPLGGSWRAALEGDECRQLMIGHGVSWGKVANLVPLSAWMLRDDAPSVRTR